MEANIFFFEDEGADDRLEDLRLLRVCDPDVQLVPLAMEGDLVIRSRAPSKPSPKGAHRDGAQGRVVSVLADGFIVLSHHFKDRGIELISFAGRDFELSFRPCNE